MCSRRVTKQSDLAEKPKIRKTKTIQMKYPAPYSQSWSGPPQTSRKASANINTAQKQSSSARRDTRPKLRCHGVDPNTVPHLKYGLFPKKSKGQSLILGSNPPLDSDTSETKKPRIKSQKEVSGESSTPLFVVRALDSRLSRRLSRAASTHLDIKPRNVK